MAETETQQEEQEKLWELIKDVRIAMLTTREEDGTLRSRPMGNISTDDPDYIWFFVRDDSPKVNEIEEDMHVNLSYSNPEKNSYVSVSGTARIIHDQERAKKYWNPILKAWFPDGLEDPALALLQVTAQEAEYWDSSSSKIVNLVSILRAAVSGGKTDVGENEKIDLRN